MSLKYAMRIALTVLPLWLMACQAPESSEENNYQPEPQVEKKATPPAEEEATPSTVAPTPEPPAADELNQGDTAYLTIEGNDAMQFNKKKLKVRAGQVVVLTLKHVGELPEAAMGHNWVLLQQGADLNAFGSAAVNARETNYIPQQYKDQVIVHTDMLGGGEEDTITFEAPPAGTYKFLCSFPGHYAMMQGDFVVE